MATAASAGKPGRQRRASGRREIITPEGVALPVDLGDRSARAIAVIIDLTIMFGSIFLVSVLAALSLGGFSTPGWQMSFVVLFSFAVRSFYFILFELRWHGTTPGKRMMGLRVIDRAGGRLQSDAVFARNLMREIEMFIPLSLLFSAVHTGAESWVILLTLVWTSVFTLMPFFNRDRMRAGDIVAGTWVITARKGVLLSDVAKASATASPDRGSAPPSYHFTTAQLEVYGIFELQTLETVLRERGPNANAAHATVARRIQRKLNWKPDGPVDSGKFLEAFYAALRAHLETKMLFGVRREDKHDRN